MPQISKVTTVSIPLMTVVIPVTVCGALANPVSSPWEVGAPMAPLLGGEAAKDRVPTGVN